jgi:hypothetical protein
MIAPAWSTASRSPRFPITAGLGDGESVGIWSFTARKPSSSETSRCSTGWPRAAGVPAGTARGSSRHAARAAVTASTTTGARTATGSSLRRVPGARPAGTAAAVVLAVLAAGCAPRPLVTRAIHARGGPLHGIVRWIDGDVHASFAAGHWKWRTAYLVPDHYAWTIVTLGETNHHTFDGTTQRTFIDQRQVAEDARPGAPLRTHLRFTAVVNLDALLLPGLRVTPLPVA